MMIRALDDALVAEGIPPATRRRIVNRVLLGNPEGIGD
jgi:pyrroline-5-carboxylate reductase